MQENFFSNESVSISVDCKLDMDLFWLIKTHIPGKHLLCSKKNCTLFQCFEKKSFLTSKTGDQH